MHIYRKLTTSSPLLPAITSGGNNIGTRKHPALLPPPPPLTMQHKTFGSAMGGSHMEPHSPPWAPVGFPHASTNIIGHHARGTSEEAQIKKCFTRMIVKKRTPADTRKIYARKHQKKKTRTTSLAAAVSGTYENAGLDINQWLKTH